MVLLMGTQKMIKTINLIMTLIQIGIWGKKAIESQKGKRCMSKIKTKADSMYQRYKKK